MHKQPYLGRIALCVKRKSLKSCEIKAFYGIQLNLQQKPKYYILYIIVYTVHYTTPHYTTPHHTILHYTTSHYITPHHTTSHHTTSQIIVYCCTVHSLLQGLYPHKFG